MLSIIIIIHLKWEKLKNTFAVRDPKGGLWYKVSCPESLAGNRAQNPYIQTRTTVLDRQEETKGSFTCLLEVGREPQVTLAVCIPHSLQCTVITTAWPGWKSVTRLLHLKSIWCFLIKSLSAENHKCVIHSDPAGVSQTSRPADEPIVFGELQSHYCVGALGH